MSSRKPCGDHRLSESLEDAGYVDTLPSRESCGGNRLVSASDFEPWDFQGLVHCRVEGNGDDHLISNASSGY
jgi:hypothetical protein